MDFWPYRIPTYGVPSPSLSLDLSFVSIRGFSAKPDREMRSIHGSFSPVPSLLWVSTVTQNCLLGRRWFWVLFPLRFGVQRSPALIAPGQEQEEKDLDSLRG